MTRVGCFSCLCRRIYLSTPNIWNFGHPATVFGAVAEPTRCFTNSCLPHLTTFAPRLLPEKTVLCSAQWQFPSSEILLTTDQKLRKCVSKELPAASLISSIIGNDSHKVLCATHCTAYSVWPASCRREDKVHQPSTGGLLSSPTNHGLTDTALLAYYAKTGVLSKRWLCTTARTYSTKRPDERDINEKATSYDNKLDESKLSLIQKFKLMYRQYWYVLLPVHVATSVVWYGSFFIAAKNGVDIVPLLKTVGITSETILNHLQDSNTGYYALAYAMYKVATPARYTVTLGCTTFSINYLKQKGYIKPVPSPEQLKHIYKDKRDEMLERSNEMREQFQVRRDEMLERSNDMREQFQVRRDELQDKLDQRRALMKNNFEDRREAMRDRFEERREELRQRFVSSSDRLEETIDQLKQHEDKLTKKASGAFNEIKENLEQKTEKIKKKLEGVEQRIVKDVFKTDDDSKK